MLPEVILTALTLLALSVIVGLIKCEILGAKGILVLHNVTSLAMLCLMYIFFDILKGSTFGIIFVELVVGASMCLLLHFLRTCQRFRKSEQDHNILQPVLFLVLKFGLLAAFGKAISLISKEVMFGWQIALALLCIAASVALVNYKNDSENISPQLYEVAYLMHNLGFSILVYLAFVTSQIHPLFVLLVDYSADTIVDIVILYLAEQKKRIILTNRLQLQLIEYLLPQEERTARQIQLQLMNQNISQQIQQTEIQIVRISYSRLSNRPNNASRPWNTYFLSVYFKLPLFFSIILWLQTPNIS